MSVSLPSRYEDLDESYRGRLVPDSNLLSIINTAQKSMKISGGVRFIPVYGESGSGKTCAAREISTHLPGVRTFLLTREQIESNDNLLKIVQYEHSRYPGQILIAIIDQYEESVAGKEKIPTQFVEYISLLDRGDLSKIPIIFLWLTTSKEFQKLLADATSRNRRILLDGDFTITGPEKRDWPKIIEETFTFHNSDKSLADFGVIENDIVAISYDTDTIGSAIQNVGIKLSDNLQDVQNFSEYQVVLLWPVADALRNQRVLQFSKPREGYKLNWDAWFNELNQEDRTQLPLRELNRTRLYFDLRIIPVRAADLHRLCLNLDAEKITLAQTYLERFQQTHFYHVVSGSWAKYDYNPVRERESKRSEDAKAWYPTVTDKPTLLGKRISKVLQILSLDAYHEETIRSEYGTVRADIFIKRPGEEKNKIIIELKAFSSENTMPSTIKEQIRVTLRRHAQFAGFLQRQ